MVEPSKRQPAATCISSPRIPRLPACNTSGEWSQTLGCSAEEAQRLPAPATLEHLRPFLTLPSIPCLMLPGAGELEAEVGAGVSGSMGSKEQLGLAVPHVGWLQAAAPGGCRRQRFWAAAGIWLAGSWTGNTNVQRASALQTRQRAWLQTPHGGLYSNARTAHAVHRKAMTWPTNARRSYRCTVTVRLVAARSKPSCAGDGMMAERAAVGWERSSWGNALQRRHHSCTTTCQPLPTH